MASNASKAGLLLTAMLFSVSAGLATTSRAQDVISSDPIWTDKPVRVDRKKQGYERVMVERKARPFVIRPTGRVRTLDSVTFQDGGPVYVLTDAVSASARHLCRGDDGRRTACGQQARFFLKRLIANRTLSCKEDFRQGATVFVKCSIAEADLAETLVTKGAAWAATPRLMVAQRDAMGRKAGLWTDAGCRAQARCLPQKRR